MQNGTYYASRPKAGRKDQDRKVSPVVHNHLPKRNAPCPCGSGRKFKRCCGVSSTKGGK